MTDSLDPTQDRAARDREQFEKAIRGLLLVHRTVVMAPLSETQYWVDRQESIVANLVALYAAAEADRRRECQWTPDEDDVYQTSCGHAFMFNTGNPASNGAKFCCYCGAALAVPTAAPHAAPSQPEEQGT